MINKFTSDIYFFDQIQKDVEAALKEDIGSGDLSALLLDKHLRIQAKLISREAMLLCGQPWVEAVFKTLDPTVEFNWQVAEGEWLSAAKTLCYITGQAPAILSGERSALNFLQTLSGTATQAYEYIKVLKQTKTKLLDTRKTVPGLRYAQKYAVRCAGGTNHRMGLFDAILIKENHIKACGSIKLAVEKARQIQMSTFIEVEVETLQELIEAFEAKPDRILLDNFTNEMLIQAVNMNQNRFELEASGGVNLKTIKSIAETGVDYVSVGAITKSLRAIDLSLTIQTLHCHEK